MATATGTARPASPPAAEISDGPPVTFRQGERVKVHDTKAGVIQFVGEIASLGAGLFIGVQLDEPVGTNNGRVNGRSLFNCPQKHGGIYRSHEVKRESEGDDNAAAAAIGAGGSSTLRRPEDSSAVPELPFGSSDGAAASADPSKAAAATSTVSGRGLVVAVVRQPAQFLITANHADGRRCEKGGEPFAVAVRGVRPPCSLRSKVADRGNGTYAVEYITHVSGELQVSVTLGVGAEAQHINGSPFTVSAVTLRPDPRSCRLRGDGLQVAIARKPTTFEVEYRDALGHVAYAEELDVRVETVEPLPAAFLPADASESGGEDGVDGEKGGGAVPSPSPSEDLAQQLALEARLRGKGVMRLALHKAVGIDSADLNGKSDPYVVMKCCGIERKSTIKPKTLNPVWSEEYEFPAESLAELAGASLSMEIFDCDNPARPDKDDTLGAVEVGLKWIELEESRVLAEELPTKGVLHATVSWEPAPDEVAAAASTNTEITVGDERVIAGQDALVLRGRADLTSRVVKRLPPGTRVQLHEIKETDDGIRARVRVLTLPPILGSAAGASGGGGPNGAGGGLSGQPPPPSIATPRVVDSNVIGWLTAVTADGKHRLVRRHRKLEANERRLQTELWERRTAADRVQEGRKKTSKDEGAAAAGGEKAKKAAALLAASAAGATFAHEIANDPRGIAFAYGGVYPGTLHARGALVKTHTVSYSIGCAGAYLLHIGLRQKEEILPGSPFQLEVRPGAGHAPSTRLPPELLPLESIVGTEGRLTFALNDTMGNRCIEGGAPVQVSLSSKDIEVSCTDGNDGTYCIRWKGELAGTFLMSIALDGAHVVGSPTPLHMHAAELEVTKCEIHGEIIGDRENAIEGREAVAGKAEKLEIMCHDAHGNDAEATESVRFGMLMLQLPDSGYGKKGGGGDADWKITKEERATMASKERSRQKEERERTVRELQSMAFDYTWNGATCVITFLPKVAGDFELHVWVETEDGRMLLPGCPMAMRVAPGKPSAAASFIRELDVEDSPMVAGMTAGEKLALKVVLRDEYENNAPLTAGAEADELVATLDTPNNGHVGLTVKPEMGEDQV